MYRTDESEEDEEEVEEVVLGSGGDEVSVMLIVYPRGTFSVSSLVYFSSVVLSYKPSNPSLPLSISIPPNSLQMIFIHQSGGHYSHMMASSLT